MQEISSRLKKAGNSIGFVPTMGCLHEGHLSLMRKARRENDALVISIFVNPKQFGPGEDYRQYPRDLRRDEALAGKAGVDIIFHPRAADMYPEGHETSVTVGDLARVMCGASRPAHFEGVCTVCAKLFNIIKPDTAYFGQKDYQQAVIIRRMVEDLNMGVKLKVLPTVREESGLARSSRNSYLSRPQRENAALLYASLKKARSLISAGCKNASDIKKAMRNIISREPGIRIDYISIADPYTLKEKKSVTSKVIIALAARAGKTRLIDNILAGERRNLKEA